MANYNTKNLTRTVPSNEILEIKKDIRHKDPTYDKKINKKSIKIKNPKLKNSKFYGYSNIKKY